MRKLIILTCIWLTGIAGFSQIPKPKMLKLEELQKLINSPSEKIKVINFWATWCAPCVKELPLFEQLHLERSDVSVFLVSMDLDLDADLEKVYKFVARKKLTSEVLMLNEDSDANSWIDKIDPGWSGALPATLIISTTGQRIFVEKQLHEGDLETLIKQL